MYREFPPPPRLAHAIACVWRRSASERPVRVMPDGCVDIVWRETGYVSIAGPDTRAWVSSVANDEVVVGLRFRPGAGGPALGLPLSEIRDHRIQPEDLGFASPHWFDGVPDARTVAARLVLLAEQLVSAGPPDSAVQAAALRLHDSRVRINALAGELGWSERQLRRRFDDAVGYGPKTLQRVLRLRRFLAGPRDNLAVAALNAGYADQAHLTRECRALTGLAPSDHPAQRDRPAARRRSVIVAPP